MKTRAYDQNIVIDLEFTALPKQLRGCGLKREIIEIGAVRVSADGRVLDRFQSLVRPQVCHELAYEVVDLTGIIDADLCDADTFDVVMGHFVDWVGGGRTRLVAWSPNDQQQLEAECRVKGVELPESLGRWMDLQRVMPRVMDVGRRRGRMSLRNAMGWAGLDSELDVEHRALDDAMNTAKLLCMLLTGEHQEQKRALAAAMPRRRAGSDYAVMRPGESVGSGLMADALAGLYAQMMAGAA